MGILAERIKIAELQNWVDANRSVKCTKCDGKRNISAVVNKQCTMFKNSVLNLSLQQFFLSYIDKIKFDINIDYESLPFHCEAEFAISSDIYLHV